MHAAPERVRAPHILEASCRGRMASHAAAAWKPSSPTSPNRSASLSVPSPRAGAAIASLAVATGHKPQRFRQFRALAAARATAGLPPPVVGSFRSGISPSRRAAEGKLRHPSQTGDGFRNRALSVRPPVTTWAGFRDRRLVWELWGSGTPRFALPAAPPVGVVGDCHRTVAAG